MKKRLVLKPLVLPIIYICVVFILLINMMTGIQKVNIQENRYTYVSKIPFFKDIPVISAKTIIGKPYDGSNITIKRTFYNANDSEENQSKSLVYYENTYIQNSGVDYASDKAFSIVSILPGTIVKVSNNEFMGKTIEIKHSNNLISIYQSLSETKVKENDSVLQGQVIGLSGTSAINDNTGNNLHFELFCEGQLVNPELYFNKVLSDL